MNANALGCRRKALKFRLFWRLPALPPRTTGMEGGDLTLRNKSPRRNPRSVSPPPGRCNASLCGRTAVGRTRPTDPCAAARIGGHARNGPKALSAVASYVAPVLGRPVRRQRQGGGSSSSCAAPLRRSPEGMPRRRGASRVRHLSEAAPAIPGALPCPAPSTEKLRPLGESALLLCRRDLPRFIQAATQDISPSGPFGSGRGRSPRPG